MYHYYLLLLLLLLLLLCCPLATVAVALHFKELLFGRHFFSICLRRAALLTAINMPNINKKQIHISS